MENSLVPARKTMKKWMDDSSDDGTSTSEIAPSSDFGGLLSGDDVSLFRSYLACKISSSKSTVDTSNADSVLPVNNRVDSNRRFSWSKCLLFA